MKKLAVKRHEKVLLAAIILSCGLVMHADPPARHGEANEPGIATNSSRTHLAMKEQTAKSERELRLRQHTASR